MNDVDSTTEEMTSLQNQIVFLKLALIVIGGTLVAYLSYQSHTAGRDVDAVRPQAQPIIQAFQQNQKLMQNFMNQLSAYATTHPDFQPVLKKYGWVPPAPVKK